MLALRVKRTRRAKFTTPWSVCLSWPKEVARIRFNFVIVSINHGARRVSAQCKCQILMAHDKAAAVLVRVRCMSNGPVNTSWGCCVCHSTAHFLLSAREMPLKWAYLFCKWTSLWKTFSLERARTPLVIMWKVIHIMHIAGGERKREAEYILSHWVNARVQKGNLRSCHISEARNPIAEETPSRKLDAVSL